MTRVSENSSKHALNFAVAKAKKKMEELQIKGSSLKSITKPSDNPTANVNFLNISSRMEDKNQYKKNMTFALNNLEYTERALEDLTELLNKAKELAIAQASDLYNPEVRKNVSREVMQLKNHALSIANKRLGNRYIFGGYSTLKKPFDENGKYHGDLGRISLEVAKDFFVPINLNGIEVFFTEEGSKDRQVSPLAPFNQINVDEKTDKIQEDSQKIIGGRSIASIDSFERQKDFNATTSDLEKSPQNRSNIFSILGGLVVALETNNSDSIQDLLEQFDDTNDRLITMRTKMGAIHTSILNAQNSIEQELVSDAAQKSQIADADIAELFSDIAKQQSVLQATYKSGNAVLSRTLLDFIR